MHENAELIMIRAFAVSFGDDQERCRDDLLSCRRMNDEKSARANSTLWHNYHLLRIILIVPGIYVLLAIYLLKYFPAPVGLGQ